MIVVIVIVVVGGHARASWGLVMAGSRVGSVFVSRIAGLAATGLGWAFAFACVELERWWVVLEW